MFSDRDLEIGSLGKLHFQAGTYCYAGSAMNGLDQRIGRHLSREKKIRWHIDNLTLSADGIEAYFSEAPGEIGECRLAELMKKAGWIPVKGFGCSDCKCHSHLFRVAERDENRTISALGEAAGRSDSATTLIIYQALPTS